MSPLPTPAADRKEADFTVRDFRFQTGETLAEARRLHLHARRLTLPHPSGKGELSVEEIKAGLRERAIRNAHAWLAEDRRGDPAVPELGVDQIESQLGRAVDRAMAEGSLYDRGLAALAVLFTVALVTLGH